MDCTTAREGLWPPERPRLCEDDVLEARRHVDACPACQEYFAQDRFLLRAYDRLRQESAPRAVRERIFDALARERSGTSGPAVQAGPRPLRTRLARLGVLAAALAAFLVTGWLWTTGPTAPGDDGPDLFVEDYLRRAVAEDRIASSDPMEVARWVARELGVAHTPLEGGDLVLKGAEICLLDGRRGAMIVYETGGRTVSHYIVPKEGVHTRVPEVSAPLETPAGRASPAVITWATPSLEQALVGAIPPDRLLLLARGAARE